MDGDGVRWWPLERGRGSGSGEKEGEKVKRERVVKRMERYMHAWRERKDGKKVTRGGRRGVVGLRK